jgi:thioredoxin 1
VFEQPGEFRRVRLISVPEMRKLGGGNMVVITQDNFENEVVKSTEPVLVDFFATWCQPCVLLSRVLEKLSGDIKIGKVNTDEQEKLAIDYQISALPTIIIFKDGQPVSRIVGLHSEQELRKEIQKVKAG